MNFSHPSILIKTLTSAVVFSLGVLGLTNSAQAATFGFTLGDLPGGGTLELEDISLTGADYEIVKGANLQGGSLNWNILIGEATFYTGEYDENDVPISTQGPYFLNNNSPALVDGLDNFDQADFIFEKGVLTGIHNYNWQGVKVGRSSSVDEILQLGTDSPTLASLSADGYLADIEGAGLIVSITRSNLPIQFSVIEPWQNPDHNVPEPTSLLASGLALSGLLLKKRSPR